MTDSRSKRDQVLRGMSWTALSQVLDVVLSLAAMLVLVRLIAPADYGRAAAVVGILGLVNTFGAHAFVNHAIQLSEDEAPDWQSHWSMALYLHLALCGVCELIGLAFGFVPQYRPLASLMRIAGVGLLLDGPSQVGAAMLRRDLDFRRLRLLTTTAVVLKLGSTVALAVAGFGAAALVIGGNVMTSVPYGFDLLIVRGWRPPHGWWRLPSIRHYRESATFGFQQIAVGIASAASGAVEAAMLPATIGFAAIGLLGRARALYSATAGRLGTILVETVYPFLPREWKNRESYGRHAAMFVQVTFFITVPAAALLGLEGRHLSRVLYGQKWMAMDPLIWPGALAGVATGVFATCAGILLAANRLRISLTIEVVMSAVTIAALAAAWTTHDVISYGWTLSVAEMCAAGVALWLVSPLIAAGWPRRAVLPPVFASLAGTAAVLVSRVAVPPSTPVWHVIETTTVFASVSVLTCRFAFPATFSALVRLLPGQHVLPAWVAGDAARA